MTIQVNETLEGWSVLHETYAVDWGAWHLVPQAEKSQWVAASLRSLQTVTRPAAGETAFFSILGHKGDLLILHFRKTFDELNEAQLALRQLPIWKFLRPTTSYVSVVELGLYEMTAKLAADLSAERLDPESDAWKEKWQKSMAEQKERMAGRLFTEVPKDRYFCFYPMDKIRGEKVNWYTQPMEKRQQMMRDHGVIGRKYSGRITQIITGSIGFDDWEWGVYLFSKDPVVFKKLIYEMRYDEASAHYAKFGPFYTGLRFPVEKLEEFFSGKVPAWNVAGA